MSEEFDLFGGDMEGMEPLLDPILDAKRKRHVTKPEPKPRKPTAKELRERAPEPQRRVPKVTEPERDTELEGVVKLFASHDMLAPEELEKYSEVVEPVISKESRNKMKDWRHKYGRK